MPPKGKKKAADPSALCARCPTRDLAMMCSGGQSCRPPKKFAESEYWRGFPDDFTINLSTILTTPEDCQSLLDGVTEFEKSVRNGDTEEDERSVNTQKATKTYEEHPMSRQLLEYAHKTVFPAGSKKSKAPKAIPGSSGTKSQTTVKDKDTFVVEPETTPSGTLLTNHFELTIEKEQKLFEYQVIGYQEEDFSAPKKKVILKRLIESNYILKDKQDAFAFNKEGRIIACEALLYGAKKNDVIARVFVPDYTSPNESRQLELQVVFQGEISLDDFSNYAQGGDPSYSDTDTRQALDLLVGHHVAKMAAQNQVFKIGDNKFFPSSDGQDLGKWCMVAMRGFTSNVKAGNGKLLLNVNTAFSAFYKPQKVSDYMSHFDRNGESIPTSKKAKSHLIGVRVRIRYKRNKPGDAEDRDSEQRRTKTITGFSAKPAQGITLQGQPGSVWDFFQTNHPNEARSSDRNYFCVNTGSTKDEKTACYYLPDQLDVLPGQIYGRTLDKLAPELTGEMIKFAGLKPDKNRVAIMDIGLPALGLQKAQPMPIMLQKSGITIDPAMLEIPFRKIDRPIIQYRGGKVAFEKNKPSSWKTLGQKFISTSNEIKDGIAFIRCGDIDAAKFDWYIGEFLNVLPLNGIKYKGPTTGRGELKDIARLAKSAELIVLVVEGSSTRGPYAYFRSHMDQKFGNPSLVFNVKRLKEQKSNLTPYMANNAMKVNVRLGNENHLVQDGFNVLKNPAGKCDTLVLGADLIHPKQTSAKFTPSIGALVGSTNGNFATFAGSARYQDAGKEYIEYDQMRSMATERILDWMGKTGMTKPRILYYRDGTGKTQFSDVQQHEVSAIRAAWCNATGLDADKFQMTTVMVVKRHATRFYPMPEDKEHQTTMGNCVPGTVVDRLITDPRKVAANGQFDFFLQSHDMFNEGSAKPTHYHVEENGMKLGKKDLQDLTNNFCYNFAHSTNAVSYASPAYYADKLCERASLYLRKYFDGDQDVPEVQTQQERNDEIKRVWVVGDEPYRKNPWHKNLDGKMFWM